MQRHFMQYWQWDVNDPHQHVGTLMRHTAGAQLKRVAVGDVVWIVLLQDDHLFTLGRIVVGHVCSRAKAKQLLGDSDLWKARVHVVALRGKAEKGRLVDISHLARSLRFNGTSTRLPAKFSGLHLQSLRELTLDSAQLLATAFFGAPVEPPAMDDPMDVDEELQPEGRRVLLTHVRAERSRSNRSAILSARRKPYRCDVCEASLSDSFGPEFTGCIQVHHLKPISAKPRVPRPRDFAVLCASCHMAAHWGRALRPRSIAALKKLRARRARE